MAKNNSCGYNHHIYQESIIDKAKINRNQILKCRKMPQNAAMELKVENFKIGF